MLARFEGPHMGDIGETIRRRISTRLDRLGLTPITAAQKAGLARDTIRNLYRGDGSVPRADTLALIAQALETTTAYLVGEAAYPEPLAAAAQPAGDRRIPVICNLEWGRFSLPDEMPQGVTISVEVPGYEASTLFAGLMIDGHANLVYRVGTYVIFAPWSESGILPGDTVLVKRQKNDALEFTVRWLDRSKKGNPQLVPARYGSVYKDMKAVKYGTIFDDFAIVGVAVAAFWVDRRDIGVADGAYPATLIDEARDEKGVPVRTLSDDPNDDIAYQLRGLKPTS